MKIERLNENQIRCTLSKEDLESRHMKVSELVYGTEKAKSLFREMMRFASYKFGFEAEDIPLMVEAVPVSSDSIVLIVTKVTYPDELDARYSTFSDEDEEDEDYEDEDVSMDMVGDIPIPEPSVGAANDILRMMHQDSEDVSASERDALPRGVEIPEQLTRIYEFSSLSDLMEVAPMLSHVDLGHNDLYRTSQHTYLLIISMDKTAPAVFNRVCNILSEYGSLREIYAGTDGYIREHCKEVCTGSALSRLAKI